jgi:hypothetical protein
MKKPKLTLLKEKFTLHRLEAAAQIPDAVMDSPFFSVTRTPDELSIVVLEDLVLSGTQKEPGWSSIKVLGPLDFGLTGILAGISTILAEEGISIFAVSTFDTDYILIKQEVCDRAIHSLEAVGYEFVESR